MIQPWKVLDSQDGFRNRWLRVTLDRVRLPNDDAYEYTTIRRESVGVGAVVLNGQGQMLLEQEYRHPVGQVIYQVPGGLNAPGEAPLDCIRRELEEETGLVGQEFRFLGKFWNNPAGSDGLSILYLCRDARPGGQLQRDRAEFLAWDWYDLDWIKARIGDGVIRDRVVICALAYLWLAGEIE